MNLTPKCLLNRLLSQACHLLILSSGWESLDSTYHLGAASPLISLSIFLIRVHPLNHLNKRPHNPIDSLFGILQPKKRSEEHTSELQSLMRISYAVFCLKKKNNTIKTDHKKTQDN